MARIKTEQVVVVSRRRLAYMDIVGFGSRSSDVRLTNCGVEQARDAYSLPCIYPIVLFLCRMLFYCCTYTHLLPFPNVAQLKSNLFTHIHKHFLLF